MIIFFILGAVIGSSYNNNHYTFHRIYCLLYYTHFYSTIKILLKISNIPLSCDMDIIAVSCVCLLQYRTNKESDGQYCSNVLRHYYMLHHVATVEEIVIVLRTVDCVDRNDHLSNPTFYWFRYTGWRGKIFAVFFFYKTCKV